jgi:hypothetical protein
MLIFFLYLHEVCSIISEPMQLLKYLHKAIQGKYWINKVLKQAKIRISHGDQFQWWRKAEYPERTIDPGQATGQLYHLRLRVQCTLFCHLESWARTHSVLVIGLYELLDPAT